MTTLQLALAEKLGVKKPTQMETIWRCVKEMQPVNYRLVGQRTGLPFSSVSSLLCDMEKRGMVYTRGGPGKGVMGTVKEYMVPEEMVSYKLLPVYTLTPKDKKTTSPYVQPAPTPVEPQPKTVLHIHRTKVNLDDLTIREARDLYQQLKTMFGE